LTANGCQVAGKPQLIQINARERHRLANNQFAEPMQRSHHLQHSAGAALRWVYMEFICRRLAGAIESIWCEG
jgi:hypothetical protein